MVRLLNGCFFFSAILFHSFCAVTSSLPSCFCRDLSSVSSSRQVCLYNSALQRRHAISVDLRESPIEADALSDLVYFFYGDSSLYFFAFICQKIRIHSVLYGCSSR